MFARGQNEIDFARQAIAHRLVHQVLAPAIGSSIPNATEHGKAFFRPERSRSSSFVQR